MSNSSLLRVLHRIGFRFKRDDNRRALMELPHIALLRINFLRVYMDNLRANDPREVVFLDETWIFENGTTTTRSWQDASSKSVRRLKVDGKRYVLLIHSDIKYKYTKNYLISGILYFMLVAGKVLLKAPI